MLCATKSNLSYQEGWKAIWAKPAGRIISIPKIATKVVIGHNTKNNNHFNALVYIPKHQVSISIKAIDEILVTIPNMYIGVKTKDWTGHGICSTSNCIFNFYEVDNEDSDVLLNLDGYEVSTTSFTYAYEAFIKKMSDFGSLIYGPKHLNCPTARHTCKNIKHSGVCKRKVEHTPPCKCVDFHIPSCLHRSCNCTCKCDCCLKICKCLCNCNCCRRTCACSCSCQKLLKTWYQLKFSFFNKTHYSLINLFNNFVPNGSVETPDALFLSNTEIGLAWNIYKENWLVKTSKNVSYELLDSQLCRDVVIKV